MTQDFVFTSEAVTEGHPDKLCDQISDAIVDTFLRGDRLARVVAETAVTTGIAFIAVRFRARTTVDLPTVAREVIQRVGYDAETFNARTCSIMTSLNELSAESFDDLDERELADAAIDRMPASHLVTVFGYACDHTPALMPLPIWLARKLACRLAAVRRARRLDYLTPDGTVQVAVAFRDRRPQRIHSVTLVTAVEPAAAIDAGTLDRDLRRHVIEPAFADEAIAPDSESVVFINPGGTFYGGGPAMHAGLTGRKMAADTYGGFSRQSAAALSGKDPTRIDRTGAYAARFAARTVVAAGLARECEVQLSYSIGIARPVSVHVNTFGTGHITDAEIAGRIGELFDFRPAAIIRAFDLRGQPKREHQGFYEQLAAYGHVGRPDMELPWEAANLVEALAG